MLDREVFLRIKDFPSNYFMTAQWKAFSPAKEAGLPFEVAISNLLQFLEPVVLSIIDEKTFDKKWMCSNRIWV